MKELLLASGSPRRKELLTRMGYEFSIDAPDVDETLQNDVLPLDAVCNLAKIKAQAAYKLHKDKVIVAADTLVYMGTEILGKPISQKDAAMMLQSLSGRTHNVATGICVIYKGEVMVESEDTVITFKELTKEEIDDYILSGEPMDKAGAYGIQGYAGLFVTRIDGCYYNVMGLPIHRLYKMLQRFDIKPCFKVLK